MNQSTYHALYSDGRTYAVVYDAKEHKTYLATTDGRRMPVPYYLGTAEFVRYGFDYVPPKGLRGCDWATNVERLNQYLSLLTPPTRPAQPPTPIPQSQPGSRLHVERLPGESGFAAMQRAYAEQEIATQRKYREAARTEMKNQQPSAVKISRTESVRQLNAQTLRQMRPRGGGEFIIKNRGE